MKILGKIPSFPTIKTLSKIYGNVGKFFGIFVSNTDHLEASNYNRYQDVVIELAYGTVSFLFHAYLQTSMLHCSGRYIKLNILFHIEQNSTKV